MIRLQKLHFFWLAAALALLAAFKSTDEDFLAHLLARLEKFNRTHPQEKVYLQLNKPSFVAGEDIWYKAYLVDAATLQPDSLSRQVYVELVSPAGEVLLKNTLRVRSGFAHGDFDTPDSLAAGTYQVRAYTNWMRNFPEAYFFRQDVLIWNEEPAGATGGKVRRTSRKAADAAKALPDLDVQFFPEGGTLVAGTLSRIGLKALNKAGLGENVTGLVTDESGKEVAIFKSRHLGMGSFMFSPEAGKTYSARVKNGAGQTFNFPFPAAVATGYSLRVNNLFRDKVQVIVSQNVTTGDNGHDLVLVGQMSGVVYCNARSKASKPNVLFTIPKTNLPGGVIQFTLFDGTTREPLAERLAFIHRPQALQLAIRPDKPQYKSREAVTLDITATSATGQPVAGEFSLAVTDAQLPTDLHPQNLLNYLLLTSDLQGHIEQPDYYFQPESAETVQALDDLLLIQGWRRFMWREVLTDPVKPPAFFPERGITVTGQVNRLLTNKPLANAEVLLFTTGPQGYIIQAKTNDQGRFGVEGLDFDSVTTLYVQGKNEKGKLNTTVVLDPVTSPPLAFLRPALPGEESPFSEAYLQRIRNQQKLEDAYTFKKGEKILKEVKVTAKRPEEEKPVRMYGQADNVIKMTDQMGGYSNILQVLQGRVAGVQVTGSGMDMSVSIRGGGTPLFLLDDMPVELDMITSMNPGDVETIEVIKGVGASMFGSRGGNGVIAIYTKRGGGTSTALQTGTITAPLKGYYKAREFYAPTYAVKKEEHNLPDLRSTLYWNPRVKTNAQGKATISFYNADQVNSLRVVLEGMTPAGALGSRTLVIGK